MVFGYFWRPEMEKVSFGAKFHHFCILGPKMRKVCQKCKKEHFLHFLAPWLPFAPPPSSTPQPSSGRRPGEVPQDVSETSPRPASHPASQPANLSLGLSGWLPRAGGERGQVGGCSPSLLSPQVGYLILDLGRISNFHFWLFWSPRA